MSSVGTGNARVDAVLASLSTLGFHVAPVKASGRRGERRLSLRMVAGDVLALRDDIRLVVEVGGTSKRLQAAFTELLAHLPPGFVPMVVRFVGRKRLVYGCDAEGEPIRYDGLGDFIEDQRTIPEVTFTYVKDHDE